MKMVEKMFSRISFLSKFLKIGLFLYFMLTFPQAFGATYFISNIGNDNNSGISPNNAWQTIAKVNAVRLSPGDSVLFKRGDIWREQLIPQSGSSKGYILYGAYGDGDKPLLLGSVEKNGPEDWGYEGNNIWSTTEAKTIGSELLVNPSFDRNREGWKLWVEGGATVIADWDTTDYDFPPASYRLNCMSNGSAPHHIQLYTFGGISINYGKIYKLTFRAKCTKPFAMAGIGLMKESFPWSDYSVGKTGEPTVTTRWATNTVYFRAAVTATDARITFYLGGLLPEGSIFLIDTISLQECEDAVIDCDVGNIIFNNEQLGGVKVWNREDLDTQGEFWYDENNALLKIYSIDNPAFYYSDIECALTRHIIDESGKSYVLYENLSLKYGAAHGIGGNRTHHIIVRDCDLSYLGGGKQYDIVRYGNGIEFWANAHHNLVERCRLWEIYDAALTNQNHDAHVRQHNIIYQNNVIWNCEYSFEYWNRPGSSTTDSIFFVNNTCVNAGGGWGHKQRPDPSGRHLCFWENSAYLTNMHLKNNIFYESTGNCFYLSSIFNGLEGLKLDYNCWYQKNGALINFQGTPYSMIQFSTYQQTTGLDHNSKTDNPLFVNPNVYDFHVTENSPCLNAGDPDSPLDPDSTRADIGAYYFDLSQTDVDVGAKQIPNEFCLYQNYPNPFNATAQVQFSLPHDENVTLKIYDVLGREVTTLVNEKLNGGWHCVKLDASCLSSGIFFYRLTAGKLSQTKKLMFIK